MIFIMNEEEALIKSNSVEKKLYWSRKMGRIINKFTGVDKDIEPKKWYGTKREWHQTFLPIISHASYEVLKHYDWRSKEKRFLICSEEMISVFETVGKPFWKDENPKKFDGDIAVFFCNKFKENEIIVGRSKDF